MWSVSSVRSVCRNPSVQSLKSVSFVVQVTHRAVSLLLRWKVPLETDQYSASLADAGSTIFGFCNTSRPTGDRWLVSELHLWNANPEVNVNIRSQWCGLDSLRLTFYAIEYLFHIVPTFWTERSDVRILRLRSDWRLVGCTCTVMRINFVGTPSKISRWMTFCFWISRWIPPEKIRYFEKIGFR